jgi:hypothetical protein
MLQVHGHSVGALFIDLDGRFPLMRLVAILENRLRKSWKSNLGELAAEDCERFVRECLARFFLVRCNGYLNFLATLLSLEAFLRGMSSVLCP